MVCTLAIDARQPAGSESPAALATTEVADILAAIDLIDAAYAVLNAAPGVWPPTPPLDPFGDRYAATWPADPSIPADWTAQDLDDALGRLERREQGEQQEMADAVVDDHVTAAPRIAEERIATAADDEAWRIALSQCEPGEFIPSVSMIVAGCEIERRAWDAREELKRLGFDPDLRQKSPGGRVVRAAIAPAVDEE